MPEIDRQWMEMRVALRRALPYPGARPDLPEVECVPADGVVRPLDTRKWRE